MGGLGSGNGGAPRRVMYTRDALKLSVIRAKVGAKGSASWSNGSAISWGRQEECLVLLAWTRGQKTFHQELALDTTTGSGATCGERLWWLCPDCGERRAALFLRRDRFACRVCQDLKYRSQSLGELDRAYLKESKIAKKINPEARTTDFPTRPPGMQRRTYRKLWNAWWEADGHREEVATRELVGIARKYFPSASL